ncbi:hypothetical protein NQ317_009349 [Molorchus minor]|uniref:E3 ubiquitin-protein ligase n=1 Tax=Molorchus minor TaxID=1323400 RepID=A0ABQ9JMV3_9CUCU|nr:hypothetical protein NQ317_009349 [Molorchus minor]
MISEIKCKKCRNTLFTSEEDKNIFLDAHGLFLGFNSDKDECISITEAEEWSKGRLNCPNCDLRIGGFDFISGKKCDCSNNVLPSIHVIKSNVDLIKSSN